MKITVISSTLLIFITSFVSGCEPASNPAPREVTKTEQSRQMAPDFTLPDSEERDVTLSKFKGKVVLLNFWATWCGPCKIEMPWFLEFQQKYRDRGFTIIAVSMDEEGWDVVRPFLNELKPNFPVVIGNEKMSSDFGGILALPTTFIIDREGRVASSHQGLVSKSKYEEEIEQLL
ncbi:MAG: alkyl hydroperoxide reductase [Solibacterales bacterium]|nr:alkyl hydroperoxide reductase [Bryobacterales bacterium]|tara:strand:+ start:5363 stop:5887 length:525 start_codon:yes stop_codon:yes gene_type:complete